MSMRTRAPSLSRMTKRSLNRQSFPELIDRENENAKQNLWLASRIARGSLQNELTTFDNNLFSDFNSGQK